jgi:hypothetical protein
MELWHDFASAYDSGNLTLVARIYAFAEWCESQAALESACGLGTCVAVCFHENIPRHPKALEDMPRWFTLAEVVSMKDTFSHIVGPEGYEKVLDQYASVPWD